MKIYLPDGPQLEVESFFLLPPHHPIAWQRSVQPDRAMLIEPDVVQPC